MLSVLNQEYPNLEYIIIDGGSTDNSVDIIRKYAHHLAYWVSEPDDGQYHAVEKGLNKCTGDIMAWINSDDFYLPGAFHTVARIFNTHPDVNWLRGIALECKENGDIWNRIATPWSRWSRYRYLTGDFQFIQQESTFWRKEVWEQAGSYMDRSVQYAGDMELWARFFRHEKLYTAHHHLAVFRHRDEGQISKTYMVEYINECRQVVKREKKRLSFVEKIKTGFLYLARFGWGLFFFADIPFLRRIYPWLFGIPPLIDPKSPLSPQPNTREIWLPPLIMGNYVWQKKPIRLNKKGK